MRTSQPIGTCTAMHQAVVEIAGDDVDAVTGEVMPGVMQAAGVSAPPMPMELVELDPVVVVAPHACDADRRPPRP